MIEKIKSNENLKFDKDIAKLFDISPTDYSNRKKRGESLIRLIVKWGVEENVDLNWLIKGIQTQTEPEMMQKNSDTLTEALITVEEWLAETGAEITPEEKAHLIKKLVQKLK